MLTRAALPRRVYRSDDDVYQLGEFLSDRDAERMVDRLSDAGFPVERVTVVGTELRSVEQVTGRLTGRRASLLGAALGGWLGMVTGLLSGLLIPGAVWLDMFVGGLLIGASAGALVGFITHWATDGRRDLASRTRLEARWYAVEVDSAYVAEARRVLDRS